MRELSQFTEPQLRKELSRRRKLRKEVKRKAHGEPKRRKGRGCGLDRDLEAMALRNFKDPGSYIRRSDGGEVLKGQDWRDRKVELAERSGGMCEFSTNRTADLDGPQIRCSKPATIPAHVIPRHPRRDDRLPNLKHYCYEHDKLTEKQGWRRTRFGEQQKRDKLLV